MLSLAGISEDAAHAARLHASNAMAYRAAKAARRMSHIGTLGRKRGSSVNADNLPHAEGADGAQNMTNPPTTTTPEQPEDDDAVPPPGTNTSVYPKIAIQVE